MLALITMVTSEMIAREQGVGDILSNALAMAQYETVYATIIIIGTMGFIIDAGFERLRARVVAWAEPTHEIAGDRHDGAAHRRIAIGILPVALVIALWHGIVVSGLAPAVILPAPGAVFARLIQQFGNHEYLEHAAITLFRLFAGFSIAVSSASRSASRRRAARRSKGGQAAGARAGAVAQGRALPGDDPDPWLRRCLEHRAGRADAVFPILLATYQGTSAVDPELVWSARAAGSSQRAALFKVVLMAALPSVLTGCRIGLIISCIVVFLAEMITSTDGLGYLLVRAGRNFETVDMFVPLISISILGLTLNAAFNALRSGC